ncbi:carboxypeptidase regulatory-like domain-containing protein [Oscillospiraceae bacterium CM]|nr:carboxypeptidase regulatory-like domain-containing protein [Oscillospiraceae bacterium CM]
MASQDNFYDDPAKSNLNQQEESIQYNKQDLDQIQKVDLNPIQKNTQNINIHLTDDINKYCGKITGIICLERNGEIISNGTVLLYFGNERTIPVYRTNSDLNGNFVIEDIPPGFYTLVVDHGADSSYRSQYVKVLPGQTAHQAIRLKDHYQNPQTKCYLCQK